MHDFPVDLVYLWSSGSDKRMKERKKYKELMNEPDSAVTSVARTRQNDELKYALRSIERNLDWVRNIYIIIDDGEVPSWLDVNNKRIKIVDTKEIIDSKYLPVFNSNIIESCIYKIPELSEKFIMSCDDMLVMQNLPKSYFFNNNGKPIYRVKVRSASKDSPYGRHIGFINQLAFLMTDVEYDNIMTYHGIQPHSKSSIEHTVEKSKLAPFFQIMMNNRFRKETDMDHLLFAIFGSQEDVYEIKYVEEHEYKKSKWFKNLWIKNRRWTGDVRLIINTTIHWYEKVKNIKQVSIDDDDVNEVTEAHLFLQKMYCEKWFPKKSKFEI